MPPPSVLLVIFNRSSTTQKVFEAIQKCQPSRLYIAADAPRLGNQFDEENCRLTRANTENIDWPCEVRRLYRNENLGCGRSVREAINWFFTYETEGVILEDDCLPHPDFFNFASTMLERYKHDQRIISINGSNLGYVLNNGATYCFSRFMNMWGWATWRDRAMNIDYSIIDWRYTRNPICWLYQNMRQHPFDFDFNWYKLWKSNFDHASFDINFTWDWQWIYYQIAHHKLSVVPGVNLVSNIGFHGDATHTTSIDNPAANIGIFPLVLPISHPSIVQPDFTYEEIYVKWVWCFHKRLPTLFYVKQLLSRFFGRL